MGDSDPNALNDLLAAKGLERLDNSQLTKFESYLALILKWNQRMNLTAIRDKDTILDRHFVECIVCARALPPGIATVLDFGSGAGLPGIPIAICRPELKITLAESQIKKAAFLNEAVRAIGLDSEVFPGRAETLKAKYDCVVLRAVDQMDISIHLATALVGCGGWLAVMTTEAARESVTRSVDGQFSWNNVVSLPESQQGIIMFGKRT
ncbi:MAG: 16S rRNA (guanine(527)-N(7))-methyltransferase RsmG [Acidobacteria bacterium]|nr:16S rRNA (guanine(527)-N(7))-methyltransferase RsmG [Acidobacteriota bacterium]